MPSFAREGGENDLSSSNLHRLLLLILETGGQVTAFLSHVAIMSSWHPEEHPRMFFWNPRTSYRPCVLGDVKNSHFPLGALGTLRPPVGAEAEPRSSLSSLWNPKTQSRLQDTRYHIQGSQAAKFSPASPDCLFSTQSINFLPNLTASLPDSLSLHNSLRFIEGLIGQQRCACKQVSLLRLSVLAYEAFCQRVWTQP